MPRKKTIKKAKKAMTVRPAAWLDDLVRAKAKQLFRRPIGPKQSRELTNVVQASILLWSIVPRSVQRSALDAIRYNLDDANQAIQEATEGLLPLKSRPRRARRT